MAKRIFFARYQEQEELGEGGIGRVFRVLDLWEDKVKALKFLKPEFRATPLEGAFLQEFSLLRRISHPNLVWVYDFHSGDQVSSPAYSLEFVKGPNLLEFYRSQPEELNWLGFQICQILEFLHQQGIIHCDLKPDNFKVVSDSKKPDLGQVKLLDFGLAESVELIKESRIKGTLDYMAPEILRSQAYSYPADLYSLGVIFYELVSGRLPFTAADPAILISRVLEEEPEPPGQLNKSIPADLEELILKLLAKDPARRISSASEVKKFFTQRISIPANSPPEWRPLWESSSFIPPSPIWEELLSLVRAPLLQRRKFVILCGPPGVGKAKCLEELYYSCQKENLPVFLWTIRGQTKDWWPETCRKLRLLCSNSSDPDFKKVVSLLDRALEIEDQISKTSLIAQIIGQLPMVFLVDGLDFQKDSEFIKLLSEGYHSQKSLIILTVNSFPGQIGELEKFIHSHPETEKIELIQLESLSPEQTKKLLELKLPQFRIREKFFDRVWNFSGGNPNLTLDYLKNLWETEGLAYLGGKIISTKTKVFFGEASQTLKTFAEFINSSLTQAQRGFLQKLSVLGHRFDLAAALDLTGEKIETSYEYLRFLLKEGVLIPNFESDEVKYQFSPPLLQKLYYAENSFSQRKKLHQRAAAYLENLSKTDKLIPADQLAFHFVQAQEDFQKAYTYSMQAAEQALKTLSKREVLNQLENAFQATGQIGDTRERILKQGQVLRKRAHFWMTIGNFQQARLNYHRLLKLFDKNSQQKILAEAYKDLGDLCRLKNSYRKGMVYLGRAEKIYRALDDKPELAHTLNNIGNLYWVSLQYQKALECLNSALELHESLGNLAGAGSTLNNLAGVYLAINQYQKAIQYYQQSLEIQRRLEIPEEISRVLNNLGVVYMYTAEYQPALESLLESLAINRKTGNLREQVFNLENLGECYQRMGNQVQALQFSQQGLTLAEQIGFTLRKGRILRNLGKSHFQLGQYSLAGETYQKAYETACSIEDWETQVWVLLDWAELYGKLNLPELSQEHLQKAEPLLEKLDDSRARIYSYLLKGKFHQEEPDFDSALSEFQKGQKLAQNKNLLEEELTSTIGLVFTYLEQKDQQNAEQSLNIVEKLFQKGDFSQYQPILALAWANYLRLTGKIDQALEQVDRGLRKAIPGQKWEEALELSYLSGQLWQEKKNPEKAYLAWEEAVSILKKLYQNINQPHLRQAYLQGTSKSHLLAEFKKMASLLAG